MNDTLPSAFADRFNAKLTAHTTEAVCDREWLDVVAHLEGGDNEIENGFTAILIAEFADEALEPKDMIQMVLDRCVENVESMVDTVDVFHLIAAHRDLPKLANAVPFELASHVGYSYEEWEAMCDEMDERLDDVLSTAIDQMIGTVASENSCL